MDTSNNLPIIQPIHFPLVGTTLRPTIELLADSNRRLTELQLLPALRVVGQNNLGQFRGLFAAAEATLRILQPYRELLGAVSAAQLSVFQSLTPVVTAVSRS